MGKKKKTGKGKKGSKKDDGNADDPAAAAAQRAAQEVALLRQNLARRSQHARKKAGESVEAASKLDDAMDELESERKTKMEISSDLTRQFKTMQSQLVSKIIDLQNDNRQLGAELKATQKALAETKAQADATINAKEEEITSLTIKIQSMETSYEGILTEALDQMAAKVAQARDKWEMESYMVQRRNKDALLDFGLSHSVAI